MRFAKIEERELPKRGEMMVGADYPATFVVKSGGPPVKYGVTDALKHVADKQAVVARRVSTTSCR